MDNKIGEGDERILVKRVLELYDRNGTFQKSVFDMFTGMHEYFEYLGSAS